MTSLVVNFVVSIVVGAAGFALGFFLRGREKANSSVDRHDDLSGTIEPTHREDLGEDWQLPGSIKPASDPGRVLMHLRHMAENIAFDVEEHNETMASANAVLQEVKMDSNRVIAAVAKIIQANDRLQDQLTDAEERLDQQAEEIATHVKDARTDALTQVANRRAFDAEMAEARTVFLNSGNPTTIMMLDVDRFKRLNDTHGHQAGDEVLKLVARVLRKNSKHQGMVCRYGGEEFAIIFRDQEFEQVSDAAEMGRVAIGQQAIEFEGVELSVTCSAGFAQLQGEETVEEFVRRADAALYAAKEKGRDRAYWNDTVRCLPVERVEPVRPEAIFEELTDQLSRGTDETIRNWREGMSNRDAFQEDLHRRLAARKRTGAELSIAVIQIDDFDRIREERGETVTELILRATIQFLKASVRDMDHVAIMDDSGFGMMLPEANLVNSTKVAERLRNAISRCKVPTKSGPLGFTVCFGLTHCLDGDTMETVIGRAEYALARAQSDGGNLCVADAGDEVAVDS